MKAEEREQLKALKFSDEVIARTEEVLQVWGNPNLFATCSHCGKVCLNPDLPGRKYLRKKLPSDLFRYELTSLRDRTQEIRCYPCDDFVFEYG